MPVVQTKGIDFCTSISAIKPESIIEIIALSGFSLDRDARGWRDAVRTQGRRNRKDEDGDNKALIYICIL